MIPIIDLSAQQAIIRKAIESRIIGVLNHGQYILGPEVGELEEKLELYSGAKYCISCGNGTDALQIALMSIGVGPGDEVICPAFSYIATAEAIALIGAKPVYIDIDEKSYNMDFTLLETAISSRTKAIIPVSLFGQVADFEEINGIADSYGITVIEDAAQSFGAKSENGRKSCNLSKIGCTSFFPSKPLGCYGDGGAIFTNDPELAKVIRQIARHGEDGRYNHVRIGVNSRLDSIQAAILIEKLKILDNEVRLRNIVAANYESSLSSCSSVICPKVKKGRVSSWAQYTIRVSKRDKLRKFLNNAKISTSIHYPKALNKQMAVNSPETYKKSEKSAEDVLSIPISPYLNIQDQSYIIEKIIEFYNHF